MLHETVRLAESFSNIINPVERICALCILLNGSESYISTWLIEYSDYIFLDFFIAVCKLNSVSWAEQTMSELMKPPTRGPCSEKWKYLVIAHVISHASVSYTRY